MFTTYAPNDLNLIEKLEKNNVEINALPLDKGSPSLMIFYCGFQCCY